MSIPDDCRKQILNDIATNNISNLQQLLDDAAFTPFINLNDGTNYLDRAVAGWNDLPEIVQVLIDHGADPTWTTLNTAAVGGQKFGWTLLHEAVWNLNPASLSVLVRALQIRMDPNTLLTFIMRETHWGDGLTALTLFIPLMKPGIVEVLSPNPPHKFPPPSDTTLLAMAQPIVSIAGAAAINIKYSWGSFLGTIWDDLHYHQLMTYLWAQGGRIDIP
jgi:hypothetical protein